MKIRLINDPVLRKSTIPVSREELDYIKSLVPEMIDTMNRESGVGLAANQVGISKRFFIMKEGDKIKLLINPEIISLGPLQPFNEGCLSIPGTQAETQRAQELKLRYLDEDFNEKEEEYKGIDAVKIQHEVDHLDGKLYVDQLKPVRKSLVLNRHRKFLKMRERA